MSDIEPIDAMAEALAKLEAAEQEAIEASLVVTGEGRLKAVKDNAPDMKVELALRSHDLVLKRAKVMEAAKELENIVKARISDMEAIVAPMRKQLALMEEGISTLNLYLGRDEFIEQLREGEPADINEPLSIRQMVLSMDQESMLMASDGGMDFNDIPGFIKWCLADDANLDQMLPEKRGVVAIVPRKGGKDYRSEDAWTASQKNAANEESWWLLRNGENLYIMTTDLAVGSHLVPTADTFTKFFDKDTFGRPIQPGSSEWAKAEDKADDRKRHFMKIAMVFQGLIDRTTVFHPVSPGLSVLSHESYDEGLVRVITDAERAIGSGLEPFAQWHARISADMRPGMRVVWANNEAWKNTYKADNYDRAWDKRPANISVAGASLPEENTIYTLEKAEGSRLRFRYDRTDLRWGYEHGDWGQWGDWPYKRTGVYCELTPGDRFVIPIDLVTAAEVERYVTSRQERYQYLNFLPLLTSAMEARKDEERMEEPFRKMLVGMIMKESGDDLETVEAAMDKLIQDYKLGNKWHRPLIGDVDAGKAVRMIKAAYMRSRDANVDEEALQVAKILNLYPTTALITRAADGTYTSLEPQPDEDRVHVTGLYWVRRQWTKTGKAKGVKEWHHQFPLRTRVLHQTEAWEKRNLVESPSQVLTGPELDVMVATLVERHGDELIAIAWHEDPWGERGRKLRELAMYRRDEEKSGLIPDDLIDGRVKDPIIRHRVAHWTRMKGGVALDYDFNNDDRLGRRHKWPEARCNSGCRYPWNTSKSTGESFKYEEVDLALWVDEVEIGLHDEAVRQCEHAEKIQSHLYSKLRSALGWLSKQWKDAEWERLRQEFLLEYQGHEELWEGHKKTLPEPTVDLSWLSESDPRTRKGESDVRMVLAKALNTGVEIEGHTIREIVALLGLPAGWNAKRPFSETLLDLKIPLTEADEDDEEDDE